METVEKITEIKETFYKATDGTLFEEREECLKYESSARCVLLTRYENLVIKTLSEGEVFGCTGSDDYEIDICKVKDDRDIDIILQLHKLHCSSISINTLKDIKEKLETSINCGAVLIGRGYNREETFYFLTTTNNLVERIKSLETKNE